MTFEMSTAKFDEFRQESDQAGVPKGYLWMRFYSKDGKVGERVLMPKLTVSDEACSDIEKIEAEIYRVRTKLPQLF